MRIAVVAPGTPLTADLAARCTELADAHVPGAELLFHPQCFLSEGHFAGSDAARQDALVEAANDPNIDAIWFARGGYGSCRIAGDAIERLNDHARAKTYLGFSDAGFLFAGLYKAGIGRVAHGPMVGDLRRDGGEEAVLRALRWLVGRDADALEPGLTPAPTVAFNLTVFSQLLGTPLQPDLTDHILLLEEVSEYLYRIDRAFFHVTGNANVRKVAGIRLGRCTEIPPNDPPFGMDEEAIARHWCEVAGIPYLGRADIGHDPANKVVPFGSEAIC
mgnify:CR=1 FL=1